MFEWKIFDYENKENTAPPKQEMVWIDSTDSGVGIGIFDGFTMLELPSGSDNCYVTHWAKIEYPPSVSPHPSHFI